MPTQTLLVIREPIKKVVSQRVANRVITASPGPQGPPGPQGTAGGAKYSQSFTAASTVIVTHNLNTTTPDVVIWVGNAEVEADIFYGDPNTITVAFGAPQTGRIGVI